MSEYDTTLDAMEHMLFVCDKALQDGGVFLRSKGYLVTASETELIALGSRRDKHEKAIQRYGRAA